MRNLSGSLREALERDAASSGTSSTSRAITTFLGGFWTFFFDGRGLFLLLGWLTFIKKLLISHALKLGGFFDLLLFPLLTILGLFCNSSFQSLSRLLLFFVKLCECSLVLIVPFPL